MASALHVVPSNRVTSSWLALFAAFLLASPAVSQTQNMPSQQNAPTEQEADLASELNDGSDAVGDAIEQMDCVALSEKALKNVLTIEESNTFISCAPKWRPNQVPTPEGQYTYQPNFHQRYIGDIGDGDPSGLAPWIGLEEGNV